MTSTNFGSISWSESFPLIANIQRSPCMINYCRLPSLRASHLNNSSDHRAAAKYTPLGHKICHEDERKRDDFKMLLPKGNDNIVIERGVQRIKRMFADDERRHISISAYDTAWVAMVPSLHSPDCYGRPRFPQCVSWIEENQHPDGSWGNPLLVKDSLCATLACIIALRTWNVAPQRVQCGLNFLRENIERAVGDHKNQQDCSPIGFEIIFPSLLQHARGIGLNLPFDCLSIKLILAQREKALQRLCSIPINEVEDYGEALLYSVEGIHELVDWRKVLKHQNKNGSLFNSPSSTACALINTGNAECFEYLNSVVQIFGNGVPTVYPVHLFTRLSMVDRLERLGIARHFKAEIVDALDSVFGYWTQNENPMEEVSEIANSLVAFRLLRMHGYDVSPNIFSRFQDREFIKSVEQSGQAVSIMLNLYRASQIMFPEESILQEALKSLSRNFLEERRANGILHDQSVIVKDLPGEVDYALNFPWCISLERLENRRYIDQYGVDDTWVAKSSYKVPCASNEVFLNLAKEDYNVCQAKQQEELKELERWFKESKLTDMKFARQNLVCCYFSVAATLFDPQMSLARLAWAKAILVTTVTDDFFDVAADSIEEIRTFVETGKRWDLEAANGLSNNGRTLFSALYNTVNQIAQEALVFQGRDISEHLAECWCRQLMSWMREAEWAEGGHIPLLEEYMANGKTSIALESAILSAMYLMEPQLSPEIFCHPDYDNVLQPLNACGRLLNDIQSFKREYTQGKMNSVILYMKENSGITVDNAIARFKKDIDEVMRELLRQVMVPSVVPRACKQLHLNMARSVHLFYLKSDGFSSPDDILHHINAVIFDPIS